MLAPARALSPEIVAMIDEADRIEGADVAIVRVARGSRDLEALLGE